MAEQWVESRVLWLNSYMSDFVSQPTKPDGPVSQYPAFQLCMVFRFGTLHFASLAVLSMHHLLPFAMWQALPASDYYGRSVVFSCFQILRP